MRPPTAPTLAACALLLGLAACGDGPAAPGAARARAGPRGKEAARIGELSVQVTERPTEDRAVLEAAWRRTGPDGPCYVELVLPEGAWLVDGRETVVPAEAEREGRIRWEVGFPTGRALDAVVRLCARTAVGDAAVEVAARLAEDAPPP